MREPKNELLLEALESRRRNAEVLNQQKQFHYLKAIKAVREHRGFFEAAALAKYATGPRMHDALRSRRCHPAASGTGAPGCSTGSSRLAAPPTAPCAVF